MIHEGAPVKGFVVTESGSGKKVLAVEDKEEPAKEGSSEPAASKTTPESNADETGTKPKSMSADQIHAALQQGIKAKHSTAKSKSKSKTPHKSNRVWTVKELTTKFGEPSSRKSLGTRGGGTVETESWTWKCDDGSVNATFLDRGYGHADDPKTLRLEIKEVSIKRPK